MSVASLIAADPTAIVITRHTKGDDGAGGFTFTETVLDAITVRLYTYSTRNQREMVMPEGEVKTIELGILAELGADIVVGHESYDTFPHGGRTYRIVGVRNYDDSTLGSMECTQCDCVAI